MVRLTDKKSTFILAAIFAICGIATAQSDLSKEEAKYSTIKKVNIPEGVLLEIGGLTFVDDNTIAACTRRGEIWVIKNPTSNKPIFERFAHGLHEPLGIAYKDGAFFVAQRGELSKISDTDNNGKADVYETVYAWPLAANYHEYSYGPLFMPNGDMVLSLNLGWTNKGESLSKWRGWMIKVSPEGEMTPIATGMRSPAGFGLNAAGDLFYSDNQGDWVGSGRMTHIESGVFAGHPEGLKWSQEPESPVKLKRENITDTLGLSLYEYSKKYDAIRPPSVWFPHSIMGISTSDILLVKNNAFGPFEGQFLVGDQGHSKIMRVFQEEVDGVYQGICFPFREGFSSGILRLKWGADDAIYVGMTSRGWSSTGKDNFGLERLVASKIKPFEMVAVRARSDGFDIEFSEPVDPTTANDPASYEIGDFTYLYHETYGSPVMEMESRTIKNISLSSDGRRVHISLDGLRKGFVYEIKVPKVKNKAGKLLLHDFGYYTLNNIPQGETSEAVAGHDHHNMSAEAKTVDLISEKRISSMPTAWKGKVDETVTIGTKPGMLFSITEITLKAGSRVKLEFVNPDDMQHNLVIVKPGAADFVGNAAMNLGLKGMEKGYVPNSDRVLFHTNLLQPHSSEVIYFQVPTTPGVYPFLCTYPGHAGTMRGVINVVGES